MTIKRSTAKKGAGAVKRQDKRAASVPEAEADGILGWLRPWEEVLGSWLRGPRAAGILAVVLGLIACRANHWGWNFGILTYNGADHPNLLAYDARNHVNAINAAAAAIKEGTLLIREVPWFNFVAPPVFHRYPFFQFYGLGAYFFPALLVCLGFQAYHAFVIAGWLSFVAGFVGMFKVGETLGLRRVASFAGAAVFTLAPYHLTDWYGRTAFTETLGLALLPWVLYGLLKCSRDNKITSFLLSSGLWAWLMMTHTILHILAAIFFFGALAISWGMKDHRDFRAMLRPAAAYVFGCLCAAWVLWPIARFGEQFGVTSAFYPQDWAWVSNLKTLFSPVYYSDPKIDGFIGLQIGWPLVLAGLGGLWLSLRRPWLAAFAGLFTLCILIAWSPFDIWKYLGPMKIIQFPYRVLAIIITFGAVLAAALWNETGKGFEGLGFVVLVLVLTVASNGYVYHGGPGETSDQLSSTYVREGFLFEGRRYPYTIDNPDSPFMQANYPSAPYDLSTLTYTASVPGDVVVVNSSEALAVTPTVDYGAWTTVAVPAVKKGSVVQLPAAWYPGMYEMKVNGQSLDYGRVSNRLAVQAPADGDLKVQYRFGGLPGANSVSYICWLIFFGLFGWSQLGEGRNQFGPAPAVAPKKHWGPKAKLKPKRKKR